MNQVETMPTELQLVSPPTMPQARSYRSSQRSDLQEYDLVKGNLIKINIPRLQRSYLDKNTFLSFRLNLDVSNAATNLTNEIVDCLDLDRCGAYGLFDRIEIYDYLGGTMLEQTNQVGALMSTLTDINWDMNKFGSAPEAVEGFATSNLSTTTNVTTRFEMRTSMSGKRLLANSTAAATGPPVVPTTNCVAADFAIPLPSFLGLFSDKLVPLHNGFTINLYLNSQEQAFVNRTLSDVTGTENTPGKASIDQAWLTDVHVNCSILELGDTAESLLMSTQPWVIHSRQFRNFRDIISAPSSDFRLDLNLNVVSLRNIYAIMRPVNYQETLQAPGIGQRIRNFLQNFVFQYGSSYLPEVSGVGTRGVKSNYSRLNYPLTNAANVKQQDFAPAYMEMMRTSTTKTPSLKDTEFFVDTAVLATANNVPFGHNNKLFSGKFVACLNTQLTPKSVVSGLDTNGLMVGLNFKFDTNLLGDQQTALLDVWAEHDSFVQIIPGVASTVTF